MVLLLRDEVITVKDNRPLAPQPGKQIGADTGTALSTFVIPAGSGAPLPKPIYFTGAVIFKKTL